MKQASTTFFAVLLLGFAAASWAGPAEEVAQIAGPRLQALQQGDIEGYTAAFADNAVLQSSLSPFRLEGKEAIRAYFAQLFQLYPKRRITSRPPLVRVYNDDLVVQDSYGDFHVTNEQGETMTYFLRTSMTWAKLGGRWQLVDQHASRLPAQR